MALKMNYDPNKLLKDAQRIEKAIVSRLQMIGEQFVSDARNQPTPTVSRKKDQKTGKVKIAGPKEGVYEDQSSNLRSSLGYFIMKDNVVIGGNVDGTTVGRSQAKAVLVDIPQRKGLRLVGVAGMNYASAVESMGYNVITSQAIVAIDDLGVQMRAIVKKTGKKMDLLNNASIF